MSKLLSTYSFLETEFVTAVDGRQLNTDERLDFFDIEKFYKRMGYPIRPGELGCTLSHRRCYHELLNSQSLYCLILEDDIDTPQPIFSEENIVEVERYINVNTPCIILLSDWFWYSKAIKEYQDFKITKVYDAYLAHAYIINRKAAELLLSQSPCYVADDWRYIHKLGVQIYAVNPHMIHQKWDGSMPTNIQADSKPSSPNLHKILGFIRSFPLRISHHVLNLFGRFYKPYNNRVD